MSYDAQTTTILQTLTVNALSSEIVSCSTMNTDDKTTSSIVMSIMDSGWTRPLPFESKRKEDLIDGENRSDSSIIAVRAEVSSYNAIFSFIASLGVSGN